ncbi:PAS domain S-box protein [Methylobacter luteus]|uniref:PAS domain S-box protein n=1 Tax=Methylobacter luteus TaxID=415 RepID=UPI00041FDC6F|nr:PAS domain S-box protein [Methylobacter luteus]
MHRLIDSLNFNLVIIELDRSTAVFMPRIKKVNLSAAILLGYSEQELIDKPLSIFYAPEAIPELQQTVHACLTGTIPAKNLECDIITKANNRIQALVSLSVLPDRDASDTDIVLLIHDISDRKRIDKELFMMHRALEQSASAVVITDTNGSIEYINPKFTELTGYTAQEVLGKNPRILQSGTTTPRQYQAMWEMLFSKGEWHGEIRNKKKNGEVYWAYENISAIRNMQGEITHFISVAEDITLRKEAELALSESEERFRQMAELTGEWLWEQDPGGYYIYSSTAINQILGFRPEEVVGKHYTELLTARDKADQLHYVAVREPFRSLTNHYRHKDGHEVLTESTGLPLINDEGNLIKWRGADRDITARKHFQDALIDSEKRTRLIIESSINAIVIMDDSGLITDWNPRAEKMFGWSHDEAVGQPIKDLIIPPRFRSAHQKGLEHFLQTGIGPLLNRQFEHVAVRRDGTEFPVELSISPLKLGDTYIFSGFIHDITDRKAAEQQIRQAQVKLAIAQSEIKIARQIQSSLLPTASIKSDHFEVTGFCLPANQVGGDYFDYFIRNEDRLDMIIADVSGHSIGPALFMVEARSAIRTRATGSETPAETLSLLNKFLYEDLDNSDYFITLFYLQYDIGSQQLSFANAGHPPPLLLSPSESECRQLDADGLILGVREHVDFEEKTTTLSQGDLILLYTDGLTEAENIHGEFFGLKRVNDILIQYAQQSPQMIIEVLLEQLKQFCQTESFKDDITLMIFRRD